MMSRGFQRTVFVIVFIAVAAALVVVIRRGLSGRRREIPARHVIMVSFDTARADHLGCYGNDWIHTPRIDALATESITFMDFMTVVPTTLASHTTLFTGKYPHTHGTPRNGFSVNEDNLMLPEILKGAGYHTAGFAGAHALSALYGFAQGFDHYDEEFYPIEDVHFSVPSERVAKAVTNATIEYLEAGEIPENLFLFLHYFDPHREYRPPPEYVTPYRGDENIPPWLDEIEGAPEENAAERYSTALRYAGEMSYMDEHFGRMLDYLDQRGILDEALLIVTSDHGENFWGHFIEWNHGATLYQSTVGAICMIRLPGALHGGCTVEHLLGNIDLLPSILTYLDLPIPQGIDGEPIDLKASPIDFEPRTLFSQATKPWDEVETDPRWYNIRKASCVRDGRWKYVSTPYRGTEELYDLDADPNERHNLLADPAPETTAQADRLRPILQAWRDSASPLASRFVDKGGKEALQKLRSLGYLK